MIYISYDPYHRRENARFDSLKDDELMILVRKVHLAWQDWSLTGIRTRMDYLSKLGELILNEKEMHARTIVSEMGKPITQAIAEVEKCASLCFYYAENLVAFSEPETRISSADHSLVFFEPQGIILGIMPWNFPYWQAFRFIVPALAAGNTILLKHSSNVPVCAANIEQLFVRAGFPENAVQNIYIDHRQTENIISLPEIRGVSLTGSTTAGRRIAETAGKHLKKTVLELGGSDPFIILNDADLGAASAAAVYSRFQNGGQSCIAAKRLYVHKDIFNEFLDIFSEKVRNIRCGDPYKHDTFIGPMASEDAFTLLAGQVTRAAEEGAQIMTGGEAYGKDTIIYKPTIITGVSDDSVMVREEIFGPVIPVMAFSGSEEVIRRANRSDFGLGASVWTSDRDMAGILAAKLDTGTVAVNGFVRSDPALPFGGVKDSGYGRELSVEGFREFLNIKTVCYY